MHKNFFILNVISFLLLSSLSFAALGWEHEISAGYGGGPDIRHTSDTNSGALFSGDIFTIKQNDWYHLLVNGAIGAWHSSFQYNKNLTAAALSLGLRAYLIPSSLNIRPYLLASAGPSYLSHTQLGQNTQGDHVAFQLVAGVGIELLKEYRGLDVNIKFVHYSNAYLLKPNEGFNFLPIFSVGYLF